EEAESIPTLEPQQYLVSSKALCLVSPVFRAMLKGGFRESLRLENHTHASHFIPIYDDDTQAMATFCGAAHFQTHLIPSQPSTEFMDKFATICDKYNSTGAFRYHATAWLHNWIRLFGTMDNFTDSSLNDLGRLLAFAYVFNCEGEFAQVAWLLFLHHEGPFSGKNSQVAVLPSHPLVNHDLLAELDIKRQECCELIHQGLISPLSWKWRTLQHQGCWRAAKAIGQYLAQVQDILGVLPYDLQFSGHKFDDMLKKIRTMANFSIYSISCTCRCCYPEPTQELFDDLKTAVAKI
ncbi:hypothetical protein BCR34DRAFT_438224, partial [Clohesyomyces aquaticus]